MSRFYCPSPLATGAVVELPAGATRHVQVLRLQPGDGLTLFNGAFNVGTAAVGGEYQATVLNMGRNNVSVTVGEHRPIERETDRAVHLVVGMPANERMDWLVEKATELGVASIQPVMTERSVLRLAGDRAIKKQAHWQSIAIAACEQCGRNQVPAIHLPMQLTAWLKTAATGGRFLLSLRPSSRPLNQAAATTGVPFGSARETVIFLSGPEGGLSEGEEQAALTHGFSPVSLGPRVLRAETAALAVLAVLSTASSAVNTTLTA